MSSWTRARQNKRFPPAFALSNGCYLLEARVLVPPRAVSARTLRMLDRSVGSVKKGMASVPVDLTPFLKS
jgi:hypothetical protein